MKKRILTIATMALCLSSSVALTSCGGEPVSDDTQPEATQGDYLGNDDLDRTTEADTTFVDSTEVIQ